MALWQWNPPTTGPGTSAETRHAETVTHPKPSTPPIQGVLWQNPFESGTPEGRRHTLEAVMFEITLKGVENISAAYRGGVYRPSDATRAAEREVERLQHEVLDGRSSLAEYEDAVARWVAQARSDLQNSHENVVAKLQVLLPPLFSASAENRNWARCG